MSKKADLLKDNIYKLFAKFFITSVAGMVMVSFYILVDTIFIGRGIGTRGLAALNIALPAYNLLFATGLMLGIGGATVLAVSLGQGEHKRVNIIFSHAVLTAIGLGLVYSIAGTIFIEKLSYMLGATPTNIEFVTSYLGVIVFFSFSFVLVNTLTVFVRNDRAPRYAMMTTITGGVINIVLDAIFIFGFRWGMRGAAIATAISSLISLGLLCYYFIKEDTLLHLVRIKIEWQVLGRICRNGLPSFIIEGSTGLVIFAFNAVLLSKIGEIGVSAYGIIANISLICAAIFTGIAQAIQPLISINHGANLVDRVHKAKNMGVYSAVVLGIVFFLLGNLFPERIVALFTEEDQQLMEITVVAIRYYFIAFIVMGINMVMGSYFQSVEEASPSIAISLGRGIGFILIGLLVLPPVLEINGIWLTVPFAEVATLFLCMGAYYQSYKRVNILSHPKELKLDR